MNKLTWSRKAELQKQKDLSLQATLTRKVNKVIDDLINRLEHSEDSNEELSILNRMDEIVSAEIFHWSNVLNDLPENCPPCMATKGEEAKRHISELTPIISEINKLRLELVNK